jgi:hypothetical protein
MFVFPDPKASNHRAFWDAKGETELAGLPIAFVAGPDLEGLE